MNILSYKTLASYEEISLQIIKSILRLNKSSLVLNQAISLSIKKGEEEVVERISIAKKLVGEGASSIRAFHSANMLTDSTFLYLENFAEKNALSESIVTDYIESNEFKKKVYRAMMTAMMSPIALILMMAGVGVNLSSIFVPFAEEVNKAWELPSYWWAYKFISEHPILGFFTIGGISFSLLLIMSYIMFKKTGSYEFRLYLMASSVKAQRSINVPYTKIFEDLSSIEKDAKVAEILMELKEESSRKSILHALDPLTLNLGLTQSLILVGTIQRNEEGKAWQYLRDSMYEKSTLKFETLQNMLPSIGKILLFVILSFSLVPVGVALGKLISQM